MKKSLALLVMAYPLLLKAQQTTRAIDSLEKLIENQIVPIIAVRDR